MNVLSMHVPLPRSADPSALPLLSVISNMIQPIYGPVKTEVISGCAPCQGGEAASGDTHQWGEVEFNSLLICAETLTVSYGPALFNEIRGFIAWACAYLACRTKRVLYAIGSAWV